MQDLETTVVEKLVFQLPAYVCFVHDTFRILPKKELILQYYSLIITIVDYSLPLILKKTY